MYKPFYLPLMFTKRTYGSNFAYTLQLRASQSSTYPSSTPEPIAEVLERFIDAGVCRAPRFLTGVGRTNRLPIMIHQPSYIAFNTRS